MKKVLVVLTLLAVAGGVALGGLYFWAEAQLSTPLAPAGAAVVEFTIPRGSTPNGLGPPLVQAGLIRDARLWRYLLFRRGGLKLKAGRFALSADMTLPQIASALEGPPLPEGEPFVMVEGWRLRDTDAALVQRGWIEPGAYLKAASNPAQFHAPFALPEKTLEGYLYPETYLVVTKPLDVAALIERQLDTFAERFYTPNQAEVVASGRTLHQLVKMASILEREEPTPAQRPIVAGILWKRLDRKFPLGVDATSRYELAEWNDRVAFLARLRDPNDVWNSRTRVGLPPGPIGAPAVESLLAALRPQKNDFWYYLHDGQRKLHPSHNAAEHEQLRAKYGVY